MNKKPLNLHSLSNQIINTKNLFLTQYKEFDKQNNHPLKQVGASLVVFLVAVPLCISVAIASGVPPVYGFITGIIGGMITGSLSGCPLQVAGPAGSLIVIVAEIINRFGIDKLGPIVFFAGLIQIVIGSTGLATWFQIVSPSVIRGMLSGIGVVVFASQMHIMLGDKSLDNPLANILTLPHLLKETLLPSGETTYHIAAGIGILTLLSIMLWSNIPSKRIKFIPSNLFAIIFSVIIANVLDLPINFVDMPDDIFRDFHFMNFSKIGEIFGSVDMVIEIFALAFIASITTLIATTTIDRIIANSHTNYSKEIFAHGVGNTIAGVVSSLPLTGLVVRSVVGLNSGGTTKLVTILQGFWLLLALLFFSKIVEFIPLASLAAILVYISVRLIDVKEFKTVYHFGILELLIYLTTFILVITANVFTGVLVGMALSSIKLLCNLSKFDCKIDITDAGDYELFLEGAVNFINLPRLNMLLKKIHDGKTVIVNIVNLQYIDHACFDLLSNWEKQYTLNGGVIVATWDDLRAKIFLKN